MNTLFKRCIVTTLVLMSSIAGSALASELPQEQIELTSDWSLLVGGWSSHHVSGEFNEVHDALGICYKRGCVSYYVNSYGYDGALAYYHHPWKEYKDFTISSKFGVMGGYRQEDVGNIGGYIPMLTLTVGYEITDNIMVEVNVSPFVTMFNGVYKIPSTLFK